MRFTIRDVLWLTVVAALAVGWWIDRNNLNSELQAIYPAAMRPPGSGLEERRLEELAWHGEQDGPVEAGISFLWSRLVCAVAFVRALVFMRRAPVPCILTMVGAGIMVAATIGGAVVQALLRESRDLYWSDSADFARIMYRASLAVNCVRSLGLWLLVGAILAGRSTDRLPLPAIKAN
jgi:hypothetical protein